MARNAKFPELSHVDAVGALKWLTATKRITVRDIKAALKKRDKLVLEIKARLEALGGEGLRFAKGLRGIARPGPSKRLRRKPSAKARAAWKAQGRYLAAVRLLPKRARVRVRAVREKAGIGAAIAEAKKLSGS